MQQRRSASPFFVAAVLLGRGMRVLMLPATDENHARIPRPYATARLFVHTHFSADTVLITEIRLP
jgi:hypothetical protein